MQYPRKLQKTHILANSAGKNAIAEIVGGGLFHKMQLHKSLFLNVLAVSHLPSRFLRHKSLSSLCKVKKTWILGSLSQENRVGPAPQTVRNANLIVIYEYFTRKSFVFKILAGSQSISSEQP